MVSAASLAAVLPVLSALPAAPATATPAMRDASDGLTAELTSLTPSTLRPGRPVQLAGRVSNDDDHAWRDVNTHLVISANPVTSRTELGAVAASSPESYVGDRVTDFGTFDRLGSLAPGESAPFRVEVPWRSLEDVSGAPGVYTVGVQVLAFDTDGSRPIAARARTFVPLTDPDSTVPVRAAMVWPLGGPVLRKADGTYARAARTAATMAADGRLGRVVDLGRSAGSVPLTVVPDPALLDAAKDLGTGSFGPPGGGGETTAGDPAVADWLASAQELAADSTAWSTAYGEPWPHAGTAPELPDRLLAAVAAATRGGQRRLLGGPARLLQLPRGGVVSADVVPALGGEDGEQVTVLAPRMLPGWQPLDGTVQQVRTDSGTLDVAVADPVLAAGGPPPGDPESALQVRQRLLAETALLSTEAAGAGRSSVTATFVAPHAWDPGPYWASTGFFTGLDVEWLSPVHLDDLLASPRSWTGPVGPPTPGPADVLDRALLDSLVEAAALLDRRVRLLVQLVGARPGLRHWYDAGVALAISEAGRRDGTRREQLTTSAAAAVRRELREVSLSGPEFVTLSSSRGRFPLTVDNDLDRSVTVSVILVGDDGEQLPDTRFDTGSTLTIGPGQRDTVTVETRVRETGVTTAKAYLVTSEGRRFGVPLTFTVRTTVVGAVIWGVMGVACAVLVFAIGRRLVRRVRAHRAPGAEPAR